MYLNGLDDVDVPELSVQLVTREGPNDEQFTEAALPQPAPDPVEDVLDDPGTSEKTFDAPMTADATPMQEDIPEVAQLDASAAFVEPAPAAGAVVTTTAESTAQVPVVAEPEPEGTPDVIPQPEQAMLSRNMQHVAQELLDTNTTAKTISWRRRASNARVLRQPAPTAPASNRSSPK
jgi:hypothetical protein